METLFASELKKLNTLYNRMQFSFLFLYGRDGTGKTELLREFCQNKRTIFYSATEIVPRRQLHAFWEEAVRCISPHQILWKRSKMQWNTIFPPEKFFLL